MRLDGIKEERLETALAGPGGDGSEVPRGEHWHRPVTPGTPNGVHGAENVALSAL